MNNTYSIQTISKWFLSKESMTHKKLQKLCYYLQAWGIALLDYKIIEDTDFEAWVHGSVSPELYLEYKNYGWRNIEKIHEKINIEDEKVYELLESVWLTYGDKHGKELEALTCSELPWINARLGCSEDEISNNKISYEDMKKFYLSIYIGD